MRGDPYTTPTVVLQTELALAGVGSFAGELRAAEFNQRRRIVDQRCSLESPAVRALSAGGVRP